MQTDVGKFLLEPTLENLAKLGTNVSDVIDAHFQVKTLFLLIIHTLEAIVT